MAEMGSTNESGPPEESEAKTTNESGLPGESEAENTEEPDEESTEVKQIPHHLLIQSDDRNVTTPSPQGQVEDDKIPLVGMRRVAFPENQEEKVDSVEGEHPFNNRVHPQPGSSRGFPHSGEHIQSLPNGIPSSRRQIRPPAFLIRNDDPRPTAPSDVKVCIEPELEIIPCKPTCKAEVVFANLFLFLLTISNFVFAVISRVSTHILIWNLGSLHDIVFVSSNDTSFGLKDKSTGLTNTTEDNSCNHIRRTVGSLFIALAIPCLLTICESRYMFSFAWYKKKTINKRTLLFIILVDVISFLALVLLLTLFLSAFEPYTAATLCFFINPNSISFACCCCKNKNAKCCCQFMRSCSVVVTACVVLFIVISDNSVIFRSLLISLLCIMTFSSFIWDYYVNVQQEQEVVDKNDDNSDKFDLSLLKDHHYYVISSGISNLAKCLILVAAYVVLEILYISGNDCGSSTAFKVAGANIGSSFMCYISSKTACKILRQKVSFFPSLVVSVFVTPFVLFAISHVPYLTLNVDFLMPRGSLSGIRLQPESDLLLFSLLLGAFVFGFISFCVSIRHSFQSEGRLQGRKNRLFIKPMYCPVFIEQFLLLNRRRHDQSDDETHRQNNESRYSAPVKLHMCATMWHEDAKEMKQLINSLLKMDQEHPSDLYISSTMSSSNESHHSSNTFSGLKVNLQAHIIFDDAFDEHSCKLNRYVNTLCDTMTDCVSISLQEMKLEKEELERRKDEILDPQKMKTPYGGRLIWELPYGNELVVHLKDSKKVKRKKRWSQILYMNYITDCLEEKKNLENIFILALDGDVNFKPKAVKLLIERMQKNPKVGAACGRIHPLGSGPIVWFQKFEYALSHWMQKSAEHVLGCVLCSPGCFSLFRAMAVKKTMDKYSKEPTKPEDFVRYDQGEDRWLSALLLQAGFKIEYCAASDAKTFAPQGFFEFFKQRRRWVPSTMGNILAIIKKKKLLVSNNHYIRTLYIWYQFVLFGTSILTPGTIFLLILGSVLTAFPNIEPLVALLINIIPVFLFVVVCFLFSDNTQLYIAGLLTNIYTLMMLAVLVGLLNISIEAGLCSVTSVFMIYVASVFFVAALLHPKEFWNIKYGAVYFLSIPSTSMLLMFYALINLHVITWGTRESYKKPSEQNESSSPIASICRFPCFKRSNKESDTEDRMNVNKESSDYRIEFDIQKMYHSTTESSLKVIWKYPVKRVKEYILMLKERDTKKVEGTWILGKNETEKEVKDLSSNITYIVFLTAVFYNDKECTVHTSITTGQRDGNYDIRLKTNGITDTFIVVEWEKPNAEPEVLEYNLQWRDVDTENLIDKCDIDGDTRCKLVSNLSPSTTYIFELKANFKDNKHNVVRETFTTKEPRKWFDDYNGPSALTTNEKIFWEELKARYLKIDTTPMNSKTEEQNRIERELLSLRNRICVMFFMANVVFVSIIYILTHISAYQGNLSIALWCQSQDVSSQTKLEPISITFILMFGILLLVQFMSMLLHRISTMIQVLASVKEKRNNNGTENNNNNEEATTLL